MPTEFQFLIVIGVFGAIMIFLRDGKSRNGKILYALISKALLIIVILLIVGGICEKFGWGIFS